MNKIVLSGHSGCKIILIEDKKIKDLLKKYHQIVIIMNV